MEGSCMQRKMPVERDKCSGCFACAAICPVRAIRPEEDKETHHFFPRIDHSKCIGCGRCMTVCHALEKNKMYFEPIGAYAANNRTEVRLISASGGMFRAFAEYVLETGGIVAGVRYAGVYRCEHHVAKDIVELDELCGTKYFQSEISEVYEELEQCSHQYDLMMFCGTPCQAAAVKKYSGMKEFEDKLFTVEVLCRGVSSAFVHRKFLEHLEKKSGKKIADIRYKEKTKGWDRIGTIVTFDDGSLEYVSSSENYLAKLAYDMNLSVRESCYSCPYKRKERTSDVTVGDFWGLKDSSLLDNYGTSFVLVNTKKGRDVLDRISEKLDMVPSDVETVISGNKYGFNRISCSSEDRRYLWKQLNSGADIKKVTEDIKKMEDERIEHLKHTIDRDNKLLDFYEKWVTGCSKGESVSGFLIENDFRNIAIFGYGTLGRALRKTVENNGISLAYIIESNEKRWDESTEFYKVTDALPSADVIIVSAILDYEEIYGKLRGRVSCPILSMEDMIP